MSSKLRLAGNPAPRIVQRPQSQGLTPAKRPSQQASKKFKCPDAEPQMGESQSLKGQP